jgi:hypothetical protein
MLHRLKAVLMATDNRTGKSEIELRVLAMVRELLKMSNVIDVQPALFTNAGQPTLIIHTEQGMFAVSVMKVGSLALASEQSFSS